MNRTIKYLMLADICAVTGFGLTDPILAIYIKDMPGGTIVSAGVASFLFLLIKSLIQVPLSRYVDHHNHRMRLLLAGSLLIASVPFIYIFTHTIWWVFFAQVLYGVGSGLVYPPWLKIWSTHLDKQKESFEWSAYSTSTGIGSAIAAAVGASVAELFGFRTSFVLTGVMALIGCYILYRLNRDVEQFHLKEHQHPERY